VWVDWYTVHRQPRSLKAQRCEGEWLELCFVGLIVLIFPARECMFRKGRKLAGWGGRGLECFNRGKEGHVTTLVPRSNAI